MLPNVLHNLSEYGLETDLLAFFQLVCENRFPFSNIAFQLWIEICRYQQDSSTTMRYMEKTKMLKLGWRILVESLFASWVASKMMVKLLGKTHLS